MHQPGHGQLDLLAYGKRDAAGVALDYTHRLTTDLSAFARGWGQTLNVPGRGWTKDWGAVAGLRWQW